MDNAAGYDPDGDPDWDLDNWLEITNCDEEPKQLPKNKKRRRPLRQNRKPSRPSSHIGQRSNNHLLRIFTKPPSLDGPPSSQQVDQ